MVKKLFFAAYLLFVFNLNAQVFSIGHRTITFNDPTRSGGFGSGGGPGRQIQTEIYYPATSNGTNVPVANGKFPVVVFGHGFVMAWDAYKPVYDSLARIGYIVALPRTEGSAIPAPSHLDFGRDLALVLNRMLAFDTIPSSPFFGKLNGRGAIGGHSMGGGATFLADAFTNRANCYFTFAAAETNPRATAAAKNITKPHLLLAGTFDCVTPIATNQQLMYDSLASSCKYLVSIIRGYHCHFNADNFNCSFGEGTCFTPGGMTRDSQLLMVRFYLHPFLDYYLKGNCQAGITFQNRMNNPHKATVQQSCNLNIPIPATVSGDEEFCNGSVANLIATPSGMNYIWNNGLTSQQIQVNTPGSYSAKVNNGVCEVETSPFTVTQKDVPSAPAFNVSVRGPWCSNQDSVVFSVNNISGATGYAWNFPAGWQILRNDSSVSLSVKVNDSGVLKVSAFNECGLSQALADTVYVYPTPAISGTINGPQTVCTNQTPANYSLNGSIINADSLVWYASSWQLVNGQGNPQATFFANASNDTVRLRGYNTCGQFAETYMPVSMIDTPLIQLSQNNNLLFATSGYANYQWFSGDSLIAVTASNQWQPDTSGIYYVKVSDANGCISTSNSVIVNLFTNNADILKRPTITFYPNPSKGSLYIQAFKKGSIKFYNIEGKPVFEKLLESGEHLIQTELAPGLYVINWINNLETQQFKLFIE
ncbi:MAG: T9SS type A sorting domain-containing protein [Chitinophagales bacterium]|nr:T9SS type A sorting domain-containing protein [Chitinophagales bacterium]MDW8272853.1 T9SS type A sorting domain-containing protein [Chitinophagales bacterium]